MKRFLQIHVGAFENLIIIPYLIQRKGTENRALRRLVYLTLWIAAFSSEESRQVIKQASLALYCYNTPGMLS